MTRESLADGSFQDAVARADPGLVLLTAEERAASLRVTLGAYLGREDVWIFAYGSLIWNPLIRFAEQRTARLFGWHRRFCLWAPVGRGTPQRPGLMLGLERGGACRGVAFRIAVAEAAELDLLWQREMISGAYRPRLVPVHTEEGPIVAVAFVIDPTTPRYAGRLSEDEVVAIIASAQGAFGSCASYLDNTVERLRALGIRDRRLERLSARVQLVCKTAP